jgi:hypothetical protein
VQGRQVRKGGREEPQSAERPRMGAAPNSAIKTSASQRITKIEFSFLNGNLMVPAGALPISRM